MVDGPSSFFFGGGNGQDGGLFWGGNFLLRNLRLPFGTWLVSIDDSNSLREKWMLHQTSIESLVVWGFRMQ